MKDDIYTLTYTAEDEHWWYVARRKIVLDTVKRILHAHPTEQGGAARILDYGCGTGSILLALSTLGDAYGLDMSRAAVAYCKERGLERVAHVPLEDAGRFENPFGVTFDLIVMLDVLEHIPDDEGALRGVGTWLSPNGVLMLAVPAYEFMWSGEDYVSEHQRRYTASSLKAALHAARYTVERCTYFNTLLFPAQVATVLSLRVFRPRSMYQTLVKPTGPTLNRVLERTFSMERHLLARIALPFGGSILCWARKSQARSQK